MLDLPTLRLTRATWFSITGKEYKHTILLCVMCYVYVPFPTLTPRYDGVYLGYQGVVWLHNFTKIDNPTSMQGPAEDEGGGLQQGREDVPRVQLRQPHHERPHVPRGQGARFRARLPAAPREGEGRRPRIEEQDRRRRRRDRGWQKDKDCRGELRTTK